MEGADGDENNPGPFRRSPGFQGHPMEASKFIAKVGSNRRALEDIRNLVGAPPNPWTTSKNVLKHGGVTITSHRPVTRRFAATLKSRTCSQETNMGNEKPNQTIHPPVCRTRLDASTAIDVDDYKPANDLPVVEEMEEEMDSELEEVEMEDMEPEPIPDIDGPDANNPLAVVEYVDDIYAFYREMEVSSCVCPIYMAKQIDINEKMRAILIDWLIEVHYKFDLMDETLYLTVSIIDRFLARQNVMRKKLQLVGVTAMLLACKYEEVSVPVVEDLIIISDRAYTRSEILDMEKLIISTLQFNMFVPTPYVFMRRFLKAAESDKQLERLSFFIIELCLVEYEMLKFRPSLLAAAAIYTAQCCISGFKDWTRTCEVHTSYSEYQLLECSRMMVNFHRNAGVGKLTGVHRKYSTYRFGYAARFGAASFLL